MKRSDGASTSQVGRFPRWGFTVLSAGGFWASGLYTGMIRAGGGVDGRHRQGDRLRPARYCDALGRNPEPIVRLSGELEAVIWDFNGTIVDDLDLVIRSVNVQLAKRGLPTLTRETYREVFGFPVETYYRRIGLDPEVESMAVLSAEFHGVYALGLMACPLHDGVRDTLARFRGSGMRQFVLSAMEEQLLLNTIEHLGVAGFFDAVYGLAHLEADSKISRGRELLADHSIRPKTSLLIGDTDHDAEVADALGVSILLIAKGHQSFERLRATGCRVFGTLQQAVTSELASGSSSACVESGGEEGMWHE